MENIACFQKFAPYFPLLFCFSSMGKYILKRAPELEFTKRKKNAHNEQTQLIRTFFITAIR